MATGRAGSAVGQLFEVDLEQPSGASEGDGFADVGRSLGGVDFVAGAAGSSLFLIDMEIVEVAIAVAELRQPPARLLEHEIGDVAAEAESEGFDIEGRVELRGVLILEESEALSGVWFVAGGAGAFADRAVVVGIESEKACHVGDGGAGGVGHDFIVAEQAGLGLCAALE